VRPNAEPQGASARVRFETIYSAIRERISLLDYAPGQRLSEESLAREFGTSRTPIRRVLAKLEDEGLLRSVQSVGTIVTDFDLSHLSQTYRLRMELAELIGRVDPAPPSEALLTRLRELSMQAAALRNRPDARVFARVNMHVFHVIITLTENEPLREVSERLYYRTARIWIRSLSSADLNDEVAIFERELQDILAAVETGDLPAVGYIRRAHISMSFKRLQAKQDRLSADP